MALGGMLGLLVCVRLARLLSLDTDKIWNLALLALASGIAVARLLTVAVHWSRNGARALGMSMNNEPGPLLGGIAAAAAASWLYARRAHLPMRRSADAFAPALALGSSVASIACLEAGCDYGTPTHAPWAIVFTSRFCAPGTPLGVLLHPTQIYASAVQFGLFVLLLRLLYRPHRDGEVMGAWLFLSGVSNYFLTFLRGDTSQNELPGGWLTLTQLAAVAMVISGGLLWLRRRPVFEAHHAG